MSFQKCPICNGSGSEMMYNGMYACSVCKGAKIIDEVTGKPPTTEEIINKVDLSFLKSKLKNEGKMK